MLLNGPVSVSVGVSRSWSPSPLQNLKSLHVGQGCLRADARNCVAHLISPAIHLHVLIFFLLALCFWIPGKMGVKKVIEVSLYLFCYFPIVRKMVSGVK